MPVLITVVYSYCAPSLAQFSFEPIFRLKNRIASKVTVTETFLDTVKIMVTQMDQPESKDARMPFLYP